MKCRSAAGLLLSVALLSGMLSLPASGEEIGFLHTNGRQIVEENGMPFQIKGMAFGNNVWNNPKTAPENLHHTQESYRELAEIGFNSVRFYLNYALFEDDDDPYHYKQSGFDWLDQNIVWAKQYGIRLVLNMHYPQGGYQSQGKGGAFWTDVENQKRLAALWTAIAEHCKDEPAILGYGLLNEPIPCVSVTDDPYETWHDIAQMMTDVIRTVDTNHIIFVERMLGCQTSDSTAVDWNVSAKESCERILLDDDQVVYEFHFYEPYTFTHQGMDWAGTSGQYCTYPDPNKVFVAGETWDSATFFGGRLTQADTEWTELKSGKIKITKENLAIGFTFQAQGLGSSGEAFLDDARIEVYDETGAYIGDVFADTFDAPESMMFWSSDNSGSAGFVRTDGNSANGCLCIRGTSDDACVRLSLLKPVVGYSYQAVGFIKQSGMNTSAIVRPRVDLLRGDSVNVFDKSYLASALSPYLAFSEEYQVPIYCGEFGADTVSFAQNRGGSLWVTDMLELMQTQAIGFNYTPITRIPLDCTKTIHCLLLPSAMMCSTVHSLQLWQRMQSGVM